MIGIIGLHWPKKLTLVSRSGKKLSTFEWQHIAGCCKQTFCFQFNIKLIQSKTWFFFQFSQWPCWMGAKIQISLHYQILIPIPPLFIKSLWFYILVNSLKKTTNIFIYTTLIKNSVWKESHLNYKSSIGRIHVLDT